jgi:DNA-binding transcriptional MocR family regulator
MFFSGEPAYPAFRLSFSQRTEEEIQEGMRRLGTLLCEMLGQAQQDATHRPQLVEVI